MANNIDYKVATPEQIITALGETLAQIRLSRNITQGELAIKAGISPRTLSRLETGEKASMDTFVRLMQALNLEGHLANLLPDPGIQPVQLLEGKGLERKRVRSRSANKDKDQTWHWDEETTP